MVETTQAVQTAASNAPAWLAIALAGLTLVTQVIVELIRRPRDKKEAEDVALARHDALTKYVQQEFSAARHELSRLQHRTGSLSGVTDGQIVRALEPIERRLDQLENQSAEDRKENKNIQLELRELLIYVKFLKEMPRG